MEVHIGRGTPWREAPLWQTPTVIQTSLFVTLVGPISRASLSCQSISGDDPLSLESWTFEIAPFDDVIERAIGTLRTELECQLRYVSPF